MFVEFAPEVLADPIGVVVDLIAECKPGLDRSTITCVVEEIAGGRVKRRRLAQALLDRPRVLDDGRSPAPRAVGDLLVALNKAGASRISAPVCAECGKHLRTLQRRGDDWYCGVCGPVREPCGQCGRVRPIHTRDRDGNPRCVACPPDGGRDPLELAVDVIVAADAALSTDVAAAAVRLAAPRSGHRHQLAWALQDRPELLTGAGAEAPTRSVLRLIDTLCDVGASAIVRPPCPRCGRIIHLHRRIDGKWLCRNCTAKSRAQPCGRCGAVREAATRDELGRPLCAHCLITDPANRETCVQCGRRRPVQVRTPGGPLCGKCVPRSVLTCAVCGRTAACVVSKATAKPWCFACKQRWIRCAGCGEVAPLRGGTVDEPLCSLCTRPDNAWRSCPSCGQPGRFHHGRCARCSVTRRLHELLADDTATIPVDREVLYRALAATERPGTLSAWLDKSSAPQMLRELAGRTLTHQTLDELPTGKTVEHLRSILIAAGILPTRDEHMMRLEQWVGAAIAERADPDEQHLLRRYALWHMLRRLRQRTRGADTTHNQYVLVRQHVRAAIGFLDWLATQGLSLADARQGNLEEWTASDNATLRRETRHFLRWAKKQKLTTLDAPAVRWDGPCGVIDTEARWDQARRLLHDGTIKPEDRLAGLLVLLYAQWPAAISRLTIDHTRTSGGQVLIRLGDEPVVLPEPVASLALTVVANRRGKAAVGDPGTSPWLFPGGQPGRPISPYALTERLRQLGLQPARDRSTALFQLATDLPAAVLARMLGIHITVAVAWQRASAGDWTDYAAEISRRTYR
ncbi:MAG TPA: hypothetical protein VKI00_00985 [Mycobacterium sp.]|uniref:hypothetical protein n=1 Tax=Mycobacterium sp. TaxID=1785 RepID=UPI002C64C2D6|nr:hypothetical protein [Mycobacterium sp.]HME74265.1 hypothetical protein [Mycobacterium sp.]